MTLQASDRTLDELATAWTEQAENCRRVQQAADTLNLTPTVEMDDERWTRVVWSRTRLDRDREVFVATHWDPDSPSVETVIVTSGRDWDDGQADVTAIIEALTAAQELHRKLTDLL